MHERRSPAWLPPRPPSPAWTQGAAALTWGVSLPLAPCKCLQKMLRNWDSHPGACGSFMSPGGDHNGSERDAAGAADTLTWPLS